MLLPSELVNGKSRSSRRGASVVRVRPEVVQVQQAQLRHSQAEDATPSRRHAEWVVACASGETAAEEGDEAGAAAEDAAVIPPEV